ncbi:pantoate--beta-alanine ligase [Natranaerofaba carboxydovora]|uniref:pantoate--beta-alanine ligase n=1 Tax=Natranaerofaba carboxydovora TaxID=2742683 RepID=UPI001F138BB2|nr:pantoate--beta-alanine ligase [Natranaerofaba carboxydovora]UMZ74830.1 Pantothenate synthetase [Natranaerofaba carboxydovora]
MRIIKSINYMQNMALTQRASGRSIGLVPTMGYFHEGHLSLMRKSVEENDITIVSLFVNPIQFGPSEDFDIYPRDLERDQKLASREGVDIMFCPTEQDMYPEDFKTSVNVEKITEKLCGASRPGHFTGVLTVVSKLFNIIQPHRAYFGEKDAQQLLVIKQMVRDLNFPIQVVPCPIQREEDGLAVSSRNVNLTPEQREAAPALYKALAKAKEEIEKGEKNAGEIKNLIEEEINKEPLFELEYVEILDKTELEKVSTIEGKILIALAARLGEVRLIDNISLEV